MPNHHSDRREQKMKDSLINEDGQIRIFKRQRHPFVEV